MNRSKFVVNKLWIDLNIELLRANKIVDFSDGVLSIDGVVEFSLKDGYPTVSNG